LFQSLLLQVSFKTWAAAICGEKETFQSLLLQVSFKTAEAYEDALESLGFNPFSFRSPSKRAPHRCMSVWSVSIPSPSGLLQNRMKANIPGVSRFNPFSFRSPSKPPAATICAGDRLFQSLLLQVSFKTMKVSEYHVESLGFQSLLLQVSFKTRQDNIPNQDFVSIPSPSGLLQNRDRSHTEASSVFQSLLLQVSFKT